MRFVPGKKSMFVSGATLIFDLKTAIDGNIPGLK
jgi:hypothetical protein